MNQAPTRQCQRRMRGTAAAGVIAGALLGVLGAGAGAAPKDGTKFDNWAIRCEKPGEGDPSKIEVCYAFQNVVTKEKNQRVLNVAVGYAPKIDVPVALITLPLGIALPPGASLTLDDGQPIRFPIERCEPNGCRAGLKLEKDLLDRLTKANKVQISFHDGAHRPVNIPLSMKGFGDAFQTLK